MQRIGAQPIDVQPIDVQPVDVVAFDFDGTLADTTAAIWGAVQEALREHQLPVCSREQFVPLIGLPLRQAFLGADVPPEAVEACVHSYRERFPAHLGSVRLFPGVEACLEALSRRGLGLGVVSSRGRESLLGLLDRLRIRAQFREVLGDGDVPRAKPAPDLVLELGARLGVAPARMLVVGDTTYDIEMGHAAGARTCAVTYGSHDARRLRTARPQYALDSLGDLAALLP